MFGIGISELLLILAIALIILGPKRLPELARALGKGVNEFRKAANDIKSTLDIDPIQETEEYPYTAQKDHLIDEDSYPTPEKLPKKNQETKKQKHEKTPLAG